AVRAARRLPPGDIVVTNDFWMPVFAARRKKVSGKVVINANRFPKGQYGLYGAVDLVAGASRAVARAIQHQTPKLKDKIRVLPNPVDEAFLRPRADIGYGISDIGKRQLTVIYVGRIHPEKGIEILIEAWRLLRERWRKAGGISDIGDGISETVKTEGKPISNIRDPISGFEAKLRIVGPYKKEQGGGGEEYLKSLKGKAEGVEWGEPIFEPAKLAEEYRRADVFVYPSMALKGESFGMAPVEAMGCGAVPVVSDLEVFREYLVPGKNGWTFNHRESAAENLAAVLGTALSADLTKMREEARRTAGNFSPAKVAEMHLEFFQKVGKNSD
ncbi:MAG: glycosyltransferase family 4 protein, partial [Planctomycetia bacterium]